MCIINKNNIEKKQKKKQTAQKAVCFVVLAERMGFEPMKPVRVYTISSRAP